MSALTHAVGQRALESGNSPTFSLNELVLRAIAQNSFVSLYDKRPKPLRICGETLALLCPNFHVHFHMSIVRTTLQPMTPIFAI